MNNLYKTIEIICESKNISIGAMCKMAKISQGTITDLKMGRKKSISINTAQSIANALDVSVDFINNNDIYLSDEKWESDYWHDWSNAKDDEEKKHILKSFGIDRQLIEEFKRLFLISLAKPEKSNEPLTLDDFTYAMHGQSKDLTDDDKKILLQMAEHMRQKRGL